MINKSFTAALLMLCVATNANANLILNGSFEDIDPTKKVPGYGSSSTWQIYSDIPHWKTTRNAEIWTNGFIVDAHQGENVLELNGHPGIGNGAFSIFQDLATVAGAAYDLKFFARNRTGGHEAFNVSVSSIGNDLTANISDHVKGSWTEYAFRFTAGGTNSRLTFTSLDGVRDTTGNVLDSVSIASVPEPGTIGMLGAGLLALGVMRRRRTT